MTPPGNPSELFLDYFTTVYSEDPSSQLPPKTHLLESLSSVTFSRQYIFQYSGPDGYSWLYATFAMPSPPHSPASNCRVAPDTFPIKNSFSHQPPDYFVILYPTCVRRRRINLSLICRSYLERDMHYLKLLQPFFTELITVLTGLRHNQRPTRVWLGGVSKRI